MCEAWRHGSASIGQGKTYRLLLLRNDSGSFMIVGNPILLAE